MGKLNGNGLLVGPWSTGCINKGTEMQRRKSIADGENSDVILLQRVAHVVSLGDHSEWSIFVAVEREGHKATWKQITKCIE